MSPEDTQTTLERRLELAITIGLGMAAVMTALFVYLVDVHDDNAQIAFSDGIAETTEATGGFVAASQQRAADEALFTEYAQQANAASLGDRVAFEATEYIQTAIMSEELRGAVEWWAAENERLPASRALPTPFVPENPAYEEPALVEAQAQSTAAQASFSEAQEEQKAGDTFIIADVIVATSLFLFGVAGVSKRTSLKLRITGIAYVVFAVSIGVAAFG